MAENDLYKRMKKAGVNMDWYDRAKKEQEPAKPRISLLEKDHCSRNSIYLLKPDGRLYTVASSGVAYVRVRRTLQRPKADTYICLHCRLKDTDYKVMERHFERSTVLSTPQ